MKKKQIIYLALFFLISINFGCNRIINEYKDYKWQKINSDISLLKYEDLVLFKTSLRDYRVSVVVNQENILAGYSADDLIKDKTYELVINANFFDKYNKPLGLIIKDGQEFNKIHKGGEVLTGIFAFENKKLKINDRKNKVSFANAIQAGPRLLINHSKVSLTNGEKEAPRTGICIDSHNNLIIFSTLESKEISLNRLQSILASKLINCRNAMNLDGGQSSQLSAKIKTTNDDYFIYSNNNPLKVPVLLGLVKSKS